MTTEQYHIYWDKGLSYSQYDQLIRELLEQNKTTGPDQSEHMVKYTRKNIERMDRVVDIFQPLPVLSEVMSKTPKAVKWLVITEAWCGDAAQLNPAIDATAAMNPAIECRFIMRDENPELMDAFLTRGGRSIPLIIFLDKDSNLTGRWGPRPQPLQELIDTWKMQDGMTFGQIVRNVHQWYDDDLTMTYQQEIAELIAGFGY
jgi:hypothetical protein